MRLSIYFSLFIFLLLGLEVLVLLTAQSYGVLFYMLQGLFVVFGVFLCLFYRQVLRPFKTIANGMDLLQEQDFSSRLLPVNQYESDRIVAIFNRMMGELKEERLRLREQNHLLDLLIQASPMGVVMMNFDGEIADMNPAALKLLGVNKVPAGKPLKELRAPLASELALLPPGTTSTLRFGDSGIYRCAHLSFLDRGFSHPFFLIESLTNEVMLAEKKAYEKVIRMIAHEVNNTTAGISSTLDTVCAALGNGEETEEIREVMQICVERCYGMSRFITNFADVVKIPVPQLVRSDLNERVAACKRFMESICRGRDITMTMDLCEEPLPVKLDSVLFEQVLVNIIKNSAESIAHGGRIHIRTRLLAASSGEQEDVSGAVPATGLSSGENALQRPVLLEVTDNGPGISREVESKLFTPFFSTKPTGQGIGLIFIREVLLGHHCTFSLRTYEDKLTRFLICFPGEES